LGPKKSFYELQTVSGHYQKVTIDLVILEYTCCQANLEKNIYVGVAIDLAKMATSKDNVYHKIDPCDLEFRVVP
jgi:hypothetical protein